jgi:hypothetical protein
MTYKLLAKLRPPVKTAPPKPDWIGKAVVIAGVLISGSGLILSVANYVTTQQINGVKMTSDQYAAFRTARTAEDSFWKDLYDDYLGLFDEKAANEELLEARLLALADIVVGHEIPSFEEFYDVPQHTRCAVVLRAEDSRINIINNLIERAGTRASLTQKLDQRLGRRIAARNEPCAKQREEQQAVLTAKDSKAAEKPPEKAEVPTESAPPTAAVASAAVPGAVALSGEPLPRSLETRTLSPSTDTGWDVDIFWCRGEVVSYRRALMLSTEFATLSKSGRAIGPGVTLGRIRLRPAPPNYQRTEPRISQQPTAVADSGPGEKDAALVLANSGNVLLGQPLIRVANSIGTPTRWYLSIFVCGKTSG